MRAEGTTLAPKAAFPSTECGRERVFGLKTLSRRGQALFTAGAILLAVAGFTLGRASVLSEIAPFGAAFWLVALREMPPLSILVAVSVLAGRASVDGIWPAAYLLVAMAAVWLLEGLCLRLFKRRCPLLISAAMLMVISRVGNFIDLKAPYSIESVFLGLEVLTGCLAAAVLVPGMRLLYHLPRSRDRPVRALPEEATAILFLCVLILTGLRGFTVGSLSVEAVVSLVSLMIIAYLLGAVGGSAIGIITGTTLGLGNPDIYVILGSLSFSGFWAGLLKSYGRWGCALGFLFSVPLLYLLAPGDLPGIYWKESLLSLVIFLVIPSRYLQKLSLQLQRLGLSKYGGSEEECRRPVARRINRVISLFRDLSSGLNQPEEIENRQEQEPYFLLEDLMDRVCRSCLFKRRCWEKDLFSHHRLILDLLVRAETEGEVTEAHLPPTFRERCHQPEVLVKAINNLQEVWQLNRHWEQKVKEGKKLVSSQLEGLAQVMEELIWEIEQEPLLPEEGEQAPSFNLELGLAQKAGRNQQVCGDYYSLVELDTFRQAIILGDGMGNGSQAAEDSRSAVEMLEKLLEAGLPTETVLRTANSLLQLRSRESFVAMEMALIDLRKGEAELLKIGAAPGFLIRGKEILQLGASSLPLGILSSIEAERHLIRLPPTDLLVITTDGVADPDGESTWLLPFLRKWESCPPQVIADRILEETLRRCGGFLRDDLTVVTCRLVRLTGNSALV